MPVWICGADWWPITAACLAFSSRFAFAATSGNVRSRTAGMKPWLWERFSTNAGTSSSSTPSLLGHAFGCVQVSSSNNLGS